MCVMEVGEGYISEKTAQLKIKNATTAKELVTRIHTAEQNCEDQMLKILECSQQKPKLTPK